ncbi:MAG: hypothetical protein Q4C05_03855 [Akkermansia sp.]|nr:hypothetical protein [Akkermansia sp.]
MKAKMPKFAWPENMLASTAPYIPLYPVFLMPRLLDSAGFSLP